jgi:hypothetical protein
MGIFAAIVGALGGLSAVVGVLNAADVVPNDIGFMNVDWTFWFMLAGILLLGAIALAQVRNNNGE